MLFIVHVIMGTNESFDWLFCVDKWVTELASGKFTFENTCNYLVKLCCAQYYTHNLILYVYKGQLVMI